MHLSVVRSHRRLVIALLAVVSALALAACGSSSSSSSSGSSGAAVAAGGTGANSAQFARYQSCLKSHGVTLPTFRRRPGSTGGAPPAGGSGGSGGPPAGDNGGGFFGGGAADTAQGKKLTAAAQACDKDLPKGAHFGRFGAGRTGGGHFGAATLQKFSACVKRHGYTLPKPNTSGTGPVFPRSIEKNASFVQASKACAVDLRPSGGGATGGSPAA